MVVQVSDGLDADHNQDAAIDDTITVTVNLTNVDEAGRVLLSSLEPEVDTRDHGHAERSGRECQREQLAVD